MNNQIYDFPFDPTNYRSSYYWLLEFLKNSITVLEIGCSTGFFSHYLVARGQQVTGVEINQQATMRALTICQRVITGDIETEEVQAQIEQKFDAVLLGDTLEHLKNPRKIMDHIKDNWLNPTGIVVLSVPNSGHWIFRREVLCGKFPYRKYGLFDQTHLHFFTRESLFDLVKQSGFQIIETAISVNSNRTDDLTFAAFALFYQNERLYRVLCKIEYWLAHFFPKLFAYQFILKLRSFS